MNNHRVSTGAGKPVPSFYDRYGYLVFHDASRTADFSTDPLVNALMAMYAACATAVYYRHVFMSRFVARLRL